MQMQLGTFIKTDTIKIGIIAEINGDIAKIHVLNQQGKKAAVMFTPMSNIYYADREDIPENFQPKELSQDD